MSKFFDDVDDSSEEEVEQETRSEELDAEDNPWFCHSSDEENQDSDDDQTQFGTKSKKEKALAKISEICDELEFLIDSSWTDSVKAFKDVVVKSEEFLLKEKVPPKPFFVTLKFLSELLEGKDLTKEEMDGDTEWKSYRDLSKRVTDCKTKYAAELKRISEEGEAGEEQPEETAEEGKVVDWSEEGMIEMLRTLQTKMKGRAASLQEVAKRATHQGLHHITVAALAQQVLAFVMEDMSAPYVSTRVWRKAFEAFNKCFQVASNNPNLVILEQEQKDQPISDKRTVVAGGFYSLIARLHAEYQRACQFTTKMTSNDMIQKVEDEEALLRTLDRLYGYYTEGRARGLKKGIFKVATLVLDIVYVRTNEAHQVLTQSNTEKSFLASPTLLELVTKFHGIVLANANLPEAMCRATLQTAYCLAVHDDYEKARDLLLQSKYYDVSSFKGMEVLLNRVIAQMGMCAFRAGNFNECNTILTDLCSRSGREIKLLLGQDIQHQRFKDYDELKELDDRERLVPPHHALPVELLEAVALTSCMFVDLVAEARKPYEKATRGKQFYKLVNQQSYALIVGDPSDTKETIYAIYCSMMKGNHELASQFILNMAVWQQIPQQRRKFTLDKLVERVRLDVLRVFLITQGSSFASLTVGQLAEKFGLESNLVRKTVSQLLIERDAPISGYWDDGENILTIERGNPIRVHHLAEQCADRLSYLNNITTAKSFTYERKFHHRGRGRGGAQHK